MDLDLCFFINKNWHAPLNAIYTMTFPLIAIGTCLYAFPITCKISIGVATLYWRHCIGLWHFLCLIFFCHQEIWAHWLPLAKRLLKAKPRIKFYRKNSLSSSLVLSTCLLLYPPSMHWYTARKQAQNKIQIKKVNLNLLQSLECCKTDSTSMTVMLFNYHGKRSFVDHHLF